MGPNLERCTLKRLVITATLTLIVALSFVWAASTATAAPDGPETPGTLFLPPIDTLDDCGPGQTALVDCLEPETPELPETGSHSDNIILVAALLGVSGAILWALGRRNTPPGDQG